MKESARYAKVVEWPDEYQCDVGSAPGLIYEGCHGEDEKAGSTSGEAIALYHEDGRPLPPPTSGRDFANKLQDVA